MLEQWEKLLPLPQPELIARCSLVETQTPLVPADKIGPELGLEDLRFKLEMGPTLSLKDRGSSLCALKALEMGFEGICVASSGNNAGSVAAYSGFNELLSMGLISRMPKLIGVQLAACDPVTRAFDQGRDEVTPVKMQPSFSDALMNNTPYWGAQAIKAARDSDGFFISVTDKEVAGMMLELGQKEGLYLEPAGAVSVTGLKKAIQERRLPGVNQVVCTLTGHGLNGSPTAISDQQIPAPVAPDVNAVMAYL